MKNKWKIIISLLLLGSILWLANSYIGIDKETSVPKALLMRIRPLPWKEIYFDEEKQLLKLTVMEEAEAGEESRCLRVYKLYPSGLLLGGGKFTTKESKARVYYRLDYTIEDNIITLYDKKFAKELCEINVSNLLNDEQIISEICVGDKVFYELDDEIMMYISLGYKIEGDDSTIYCEGMPTLKTMLTYTYEDSGIEKYELGELDIQR